MPSTLGTPTGLAWAGMSPDGDEERIIRAYVQLAVTRWEAHGFRTVTVARFGALEVRLTEILEEQRLPNRPRLWLELCSPARHLIIDSCGCTELDESELAQVAEFMAAARQRTQEFHQEDAISPDCMWEVLRSGPFRRPRAEPGNPARRRRAHLHEG
ncbi:hypothetical protein KBI52_05655 [Microvirga sp. HBU67558]|uniref:hypothetical protein n=1 Tax=Microvirga TaxID=186650 RepID=UPI001B374943|nr:MULTISPECIES: hypothetical protein [unclassified Microvirga]MBQ0819704.1 hypothetical protein [Microvirga sp. HBU67558]